MLEDDEPARRLAEAGSADPADPAPQTPGDGSSADSVSTDSGGEVLLGEVIERLGKMEEHIAEFHRRSAHRESIIDRLHEENQQFRGGIARAVLEPVIADLVRLYDQLDREARRLGEDGQLLRSFADDVVLILDRCGLEVFSAEPGDRFEHDRHRPLAVVPCDDEARHNTVAEVVAVGFVERDTGRVRRPVQARFYQYSPRPDEADESTTGRDESEASSLAPRPEGRGLSSVEGRAHG